VLVALAVRGNAVLSVLFPLNGVLFAAMVGDLFHAIGRPPTGLAVQVFSESSQALADRPASGAP